MGEPSMRFLFETSADDGYVPVLGDSTLDGGNIVTQIAGSTNAGLYYQVGGAGLNGLFAAGLEQAGQCDDVNQQLRSRYDSRFGTNAWSKANTRPPNPPPLTSFVVPIRPGVAPIGAQVGGVVYSVGPILGPAGLTDPATYQAIYEDGFREIASALADGVDIAGARLTMLSTGIYAASVHDPRALFADAAIAIIDAATTVAAGHQSLTGVTMLINSAGTGVASKEREAFAGAAEHRDCAPLANADGFSASIA